MRKWNDIMIKKREVLVDYNQIRKEGPLTVRVSKLRTKLRRKTVGFIDRKNETLEAKQRNFSWMQRKNKRKKR